MYHTKIRLILCVETNVGYQYNLITKVLLLNSIVEA